MIPSYDFSKAKTIVSVDADFLNSWLLSTEYTGQYALTRNPDAEWMSKHIQFETVLSVTGSNADYRGMIKPSEQAAVLAYLIKGLGGNAGVASDLNPSAKLAADQAIKALKKSKKESLVVSGSNNIGVQQLTNKLNNMLQTYGTTIDLSNPVNLFQSEDAKVSKLVKDVTSGKGPDVLLMMDVNPVYTLPNGDAFENPAITTKEAAKTQAQEAEEGQAQ